MLNPLSADHGFLRERLLPGLIRQVEANWAAQVRDVRLFEVGTAFQAAPGRPSETTRVAAVVTGAALPAHWSDGGKGADVVWWDLKGLFQRAVSLANPGALVQVDGGDLVARSADGRLVGRASILVADAPPWAAPLFGLEVELSVAARVVPPFVAPPMVPAAIRDLGLVVPWAVTADAVVAEIRKIGAGLLESVGVVDEYRGAGVPDGSRSVAFRLVFRRRDRTLKDSEVDSAVTRIRGGLEKQLGVSLRTS